MHQPESPTVDGAAKAKRGERDKEDRMRGAADGKRWASERASRMRLEEMASYAHDEGRLFAPEVNQITEYYLFELLVNLDLMVDPSLSREDKDRAWFPPEGTRLSRAYVRAFFKAAAEAQKEVMERVG